MFVLAVATSIDALAAGITFAFLGADIFRAAALTGAITFAVAACGVKIGNIFGTKFKTGAELAGGAILVSLGVKILLEHTIFS
jgi:putative Mn2+ efflux pump MntP